MMDCQMITKKNVLVDVISENAEEGLTSMVPRDIELSELCDESFESCLVESVYDISHFVDKKLNNEKLVRSESL